MPYAFNGTCYSTPVDAYNVFKNTYPSVNHDSIISLRSSSLNQNNGTISFSFTVISISNKNNNSSLSGSIVLTPCSLSENVNAYSYLDGAAIWSFFFSFTVLCWFVAKNVGLVLQFIKRH